MTDDDFLAKWRAAAVGGMVDGGPKCVVCGQRPRRSKKRTCMDCQSKRNAILVRRLPAFECVYFAGAYLPTGQLYAVKIGRTKRNIIVHLECYQAGSPLELRLFGVVRTKRAVQLEAELHFQFGSARLKGEWFLPTAELVTRAKASDPYPDRHAASPPVRR